MPSIIAVIGFSNSGKTTLIEQLVSKFTKENLKIGAIKHCHNPLHSLDVKGKDSWRFSQAGAKITVCASPKEIAIFKKQKNLEEDFEEIEEILKNEEIDLWLIEGFRSHVNYRSDVKKIVIVKSEEEMENALKETQRQRLAIVGPPMLREKMPSKAKIPFFDTEEAENKLFDLIKQFL